MSNKESDQKSKVEAGEASTFSTPSEANSTPANSPESADIKDLEDNHTSDNQDSGMQNIAPQPKVTQANNPLHGVKLQMIVEQLHEKYGWDGLAYRINIKCFKSDPSVKSSLKFLRRTPWAREKVERLYLKTFHKKYRPESY
ncbi:MAG: hypothetical protein ACI9O6_003278 [Glaciecola sp.]|jgi:hypothetical protein